MCARFTLKVTADLLERFEVQQTIPLPESHFNIAPTDPVAVITQEDGVRHLETHRWGLVPFWAKDLSIGSRQINARAETVAEKPAFKNALRRRRCLVPADGFYEWITVAKAKQPIYIHRPDAEVFAFAGLWEEWRPAEGSPIRSCTIITVAANATMSPIHDRMPAILPREWEARWLDPRATPEAVLQLLQPYTGELETYPVDRRVNRPGVNGPECVAPIDAGPQPGENWGTGTLGF